MYKKILIIGLAIISFSCNKEEKQNIPEYLNIELKDWNGKTHKLKDHTDKIVILDFWATWCVPCGEAAPLISKLEASFKDKDVLFLGINTDSDRDVTLGAIKKKGKEFGMTYNSLLDPSQELARALNVIAQPGLFFIDRKGKVFHKQYGLQEMDIPGLKKKIDEKLK